MSESKLDCGECLWLGNCGGARCHPDNNPLARIFGKSAPEPVLKEAPVAFSFSIDKRQTAAYWAWFAKHDCKFMDPENCGAIGGGLTWCFTGTSLGQVVNVECVCGGGVDLSFFGDW